jgi:hypothetical protein
MKESGMFVKEIFSGLNPGNKPVGILFDNKYKPHPDYFNFFCKNA